MTIPDHNTLLIRFSNGFMKLNRKNRRALHAFHLEHFFLHHKFKRCLQVFKNFEISN